LRKLNVHNIEKNLKNNFLAQNIIVYDELISTQSLAHKLALAGSKEGTIIVSNIQTHGTGRYSRSWFSPLGGLWFSIILRPNNICIPIQKLNLISGLTIVKTLNRLYKINAFLKWPNDVIIQDKKISGVITESNYLGNKLDYVVLGIGINVNFEINSLPTSIQSTSTTLQTELNKKVNLIKLLTELLNELALSYLNLSAPNPIIIPEWKLLIDTLNQKVIISLNGVDYTGTATDVFEDGSLQLTLLDGSHKNFFDGKLRYLK